MSRSHRIYLSCQCKIPDHLVQVELNPDEDPPEIFMSTLLNPQVSFWTRLWISIRYIFGVSGCDKYYHFESVILDENSINELSSLLTYRRALMKLRETKKKKDKLDEVRNRKAKQSGTAAVLKTDGS